MAQPDNEKSLRHSIKDATAYAVMMGIGETYLSAFALYLKASTPQIGLLAALPPLLGSLAQLLSAWLGRLVGRRRPIILAGAGLQAFAWLPIAFLPLLFPSAAVPILIGAVVIYHCGAHLAAPQWASMMGDLVPTKRRGRFFARRTRIISIVTFVSLAAGGLILHEANAGGRTLAGFLVLFGVLDRVGALAGTGRHDQLQRLRERRLHRVEEPEEVAQGQQGPRGGTRRDVPGACAHGR